MSGFQTRSLIDYDPLLHFISRSHLKANNVIAHAILHLELFGNLPTIALISYVVTLLDSLSLDWHIWCLMVSVHHFRVYTLLGFCTLFSFYTSLGFYTIFGSYRCRIRTQQFLIEL